MRKGNISPANLGTALPLLAKGVHREFAVGRRRSAHHTTVFDLGGSSCRKRRGLPSRRGRRNQTAGPDRRASSLVAAGSGRSPVNRLVAGNRRSPANVERVVHVVELYVTAAVSVAVLASIPASIIDIASARLGADMVLGVAAVGHRRHIHKYPKLDRLPRVQVAEEAVLAPPQKSPRPSEKICVTSLGFG